MVHSPIEKIFSHFLLHNKKIFPTFAVEKTIARMTTMPKIHLLEQRESVQLLESQRITPPYQQISKGAVSLLLAALSILLFCACGKDDIPILQSEAPTAEVELRRLLPGSSWHIAQLGYTEGDVEVNAAWQGMTVDFTSDSAFFYRRDLVYDPISHTKCPETTLAARFIFGIKEGKITLETTEFRVESAYST